MAGPIHRFEDFKILIVEGMDNTGKTTLCDQLSRAFDLPLIHSIGGPGISSKEMTDWIKLWLHRGRAIGGIVIDRLSLISEPIYGELLRGQSNLDPEDARETWALVAEMSPTIIYCRPPLDTILRSMEDRPQMSGVVDNALRLIRDYDQAFLHLHTWGGVPSYLRYNWDADPQALDLIEEIKERA